MKITQQHIDDGEDEIIIRYKEKTPDIIRLLSTIENNVNSLIVFNRGKQETILFQDIIYIESVDKTSFLYTKNHIYSIKETLSKIASQYHYRGYFRCSKSMIVDIYHITQLKSIAGNRIDALLDNGEHILISRRYARELRAILKGGSYE